MSPRTLIFLASLILAASVSAWADPPVASYLFPAGGPRGATVPVRVGGLNLHHRCSFEILGPGVSADATWPECATTWFEGPILPLPESQQVEDYPKDHAGSIAIAPDAKPGVRFSRVWTAQGASTSLPFVVGDLPEIVESEVEGDPVAVRVTIPVTINGRIFPREDVDLWSFLVRKGETITCEVWGARLGTPLDARLVVSDPQGRTVAECDDAIGPDPRLHFTATADGAYQVRIEDAHVRGSQAHVYRLTVTSGPHVDAVYPLGGRRGTKTMFELAGAALPSDPVEIALPEGSGAETTLRATLPAGTTNPFLVALDDLPEVYEPAAADPPEVTLLPAILNGRIETPGDVDIWPLTLQKGVSYEVHVLARALGSPLDALIALLDKDGKELARAEGQPKGPADPALTLTVPADGTYRLRIADRFRSRGSMRHAYRVRIEADRRPDFSLYVASDALTLLRGKDAKLKVEIERKGKIDGPIELTVDGLPPGVSVGKATIAPNQAGAELTFKAEAKAPIRVAHLVIRGTATLGGSSVARTATARAPRGQSGPETVLLAVALSTPFEFNAATDFRWAARGTVVHRHYKIERKGFEGPIEFRLADRQARHLQGVTGPTITVAADATEFDYPVRLPPWMETGRTSRSVVMGLAVVRDDEGNEHEVSYTTTKVDYQITAVVEPGRLAIEAGTGSIPMTPGRTVAVPVRITRGKGLSGPVTVEVIAPADLDGIKVEPVTIAADRSEQSLAFECRSAPGPIARSIVIRATLLDQGDPVCAETSLTLQLEPSLP